jgi:hypothetical protein
MSTFKHEIRFKQNQLDGLEMKLRTVKKTVTFRELDETNKDQHRLHFRIMSLYKTKMEVDERTKTMSIDTDVLYEITVESVKLLAVVDDSFTEMEMKEFLASSIGVLKFGLWFLENHITPFILEYNS